MIPAKCRTVTISQAAGLLAAVCLLCPAAALGGGPAPATAPRAATQPARPADPVAELMAAGWGELELVNYPKAQKTFEQVLDAGPSRPRQAEALFALAYLWQYRQPGADVDEARRVYRQVADEFKDTPAGPLALLSLARLADAPQYEKDRDRKQARELYRQILQRYGEHFVAEEAVLRLGMTYMEDPTDTASEDKGIQILTDHLAKRPDSFLAPVMHLQLGGVLEGRKEYRKAVDHWIAADTIDAKAGQDRTMDRSARANLYFRIAKVAERRLKDYPLAVRWYDRIVNEIRRDNKYFVSKLSAERCRKLAAGAKSGAKPAPTTAPATGKEARP